MRRRTILFFILAILVTGLFGVYYKYVYLTKDTTGPVITADADEITASIHSTDEELMVGMEAIDDVDGDVSSTLVVESIRIVEKKKCKVTYAASDSKNNVSKYTRFVTLEDYTPARFTITDRLLFPVGTYTAKILNYVRVNDCIDGDITGRMRLSGEINDTSNPGVYDYTVTVSNSIGDTFSAPIAVEYINDTTENRIHYPVLYLTDYLVYVKKGEEFHPKKYLDHLLLANKYYKFSSSEGYKVIDINSEESIKTTTTNGDIVSGTIHMSAIHVDTNVDVSKPGNYQATFSCTTADGYFGSVQMVVIVEE